jgi:hypothetical protein|nr:MAG TPA: Protein of unknown function (DUF1653) [Caudoviricetes sp.]
MSKSTFIQPLITDNRNPIEEITKEPELKVLSTYKHYKGGMYLYLGEAFQGDMLTTMAIYKELNPRGHTFVCPIEEFIEKFEYCPLGLQI